MSAGEARGRATGWALETALRKRKQGVPALSVAEAAALLGISTEYLYRLLRADAFPSVRMRLAGEKGRYVIPAKAVDRLLDDATEAGACVDVAEWSGMWRAGISRAGEVPA